MAAVSDPHVFVVMGATGDLMGRKLLPAIHRLMARGALGGRSVVLGVGMETNLDDKSFAARCIGNLKADGVPAGEIASSGEADRIFYQSIVKGTPEDYRTLGSRIEKLEAEHGLPGNRVLYLALPPKVFPLAITGLGNAGLNQSKGWTRLVIEKPFGRDLQSAMDLNHVAHQFFDEDQIYRIDHYLGKETVQNLMAFRFANSMFEPLWNRDRVDSVEITVAETLGVEHRALYYEGAGALRDMVQNHLTQIMTMAAMEVPAAFNAAESRHEKAKVLASVMPIQIKDVVFGQYAEGEIDGEAVSAYRDEPGVAPNSQTETYVALKLEIANWRWQGVPFFLRSGKRLAARQSKIVVTFRCPPISLFQPFGVSTIHPNQLVITLQPGEGFDLYFEIKQPGQGMRVETDSLSFRYADKYGELPEAYETLLLDVVHGDASLFVRDDWVEASWKLYTPLLQNRPKVLSYRAGSWGPAEADDLLTGLGRTWTNL